MFGLEKTTKKGWLKFVCKASYYFVILPVLAVIFLSNRHLVWTPKVMYADGITANSILLGSDRLGPQVWLDTSGGQASITAKSDAQGGLVSIGISKEGVPIAMMKHGGVSWNGEPPASERKRLMLLMKSDTGTHLGYEFGDELIDVRVGQNPESDAKQLVLQRSNNSGRVMWALEWTAEGQPYLIPIESETFETNADFEADTADALDMESNDSQ